MPVEACGAAGWVLIDLPIVLYTCNIWASHETLATQFSFLHSLSYPSRWLVVLYVGFLANDDNAGWIAISETMRSSLTSMRTCLTRMRWQFFPFICYHPCVSAVLRGIVLGWCCCGRMRESVIGHRPAAASVAAVSWSEKGASTASWSGETD